MSGSGRLRQELRYYRALAGDRRTPKIAKWLLAGAVAYLLMPFDLIPDFIPLLGQLDDVLIVPAIIWLGLSCIPAELKSDIRRAVRDEALEEQRYDG